MVLVALTLLLLAGIVAYFVGALRLAKYGFRLSTGIGWAVILFPPYTFYFAFKKLEVDGKEFPTALCSFGLILSALLIAAFFQPLSAMAVGDFSRAHDMLSAEIMEEEEITDEEILALIAAGDEDELEGDEEALERAEELEEAVEERQREAEEEAEAQEEDEAEAQEDAEEEEDADDEE